MRLPHFGDGVIDSRGVRKRFADAFELEPSGGLIGVDMDAKHSGSHQQRVKRGRHLRYQLARHHRSMNPWRFRLKMAVGVGLGVFICVLGLYMLVEADGSEA